MGEMQVRGGYGKKNTPLVDEQAFDCQLPCTIHQPKPETRTSRTPVEIFRNS